MNREKSLSLYILGLRNLSIIKMAIFIKKIDIFIYLKFYLSIIKSKILYSLTFYTKIYNLIIVNLEGISMLKMKRVSETYDMKVFTDSGDYFGDVEESILTSNKVFGWRVRATKNSFLTKVLGSAKGVIVPHQLVKSIGDIIIISKAAVPSYSGEEEAREE
jgi:sporulation protein YlmC with PRC-barrel domain